MVASIASLLEFISLYLVAKYEPPVLSVIDNIDKNFLFDGIKYIKNHSCVSRRKP